jgi:hypothetical protein
MAAGWGPSGAGTALDALVAAYQWMKLHTASPGAAGTTAPATETTRKQFAFAATGTDGIVENTGAVAWTNIAATGTEDATFFTAWSASTAGNFGYSGTITANAFVTGDTYEVAAGALVVSVPLAS